MNLTRQCLDMTRQDKCVCVWGGGGGGGGGNYVTLVYRDIHEGSYLLQNRHHFRERSRGHQVPDIVHIVLWQVTIKLKK